MDVDIDGPREREEEPEDDGAALVLGDGEEELPTLVKTNKPLLNAWRTVVKALGRKIVVAPASGGAGGYYLQLPEMPAGEASILDTYAPFLAPEVRTASGEEHFFLICKIGNCTSAVRVDYIEKDKIKLKLKNVVDHFKATHPSLCTEKHAKEAIKEAAAAGERKRARAAEAAPAASAVPGAMPLTPKTKREMAEDVMRMVVVGALPFNIVNNAGFIYFCNKNGLAVPHYDMVRRLFIESYAKITRPLRARLSPTRRSRSRTLRARYRVTNSCNKQRERCCPTPLSSVLETRHPHPHRPPALQLARPSPSPPSPCSRCETLPCRQSIPGGWGWRGWRPSASPVATPYLHRSRR